MKSEVAVLICGLVVLVEQSALAQFHQKDKSGQSNLNQNAVKAATQPVTPGGVSPIRTGRITKDVGLNARSTMIMTDAQRELFRKNNLRMGLQEDLEVDHLARSIQHTDGSYTQTNVEIGSDFVEQETKSKNGVLLLKRRISLDKKGNPQEILMYDGRDILKYRGVLVYDERGRFREEQLFDAKGKSLRRKVQEYDAKGVRLPLKTFEYVSNVPSDLRMVVTRESERQDRTQPEVGSDQKKTKDRKGIFNTRKTDKTNPSPPSTAQAPNSKPSGDAKEKKGFALPRFSFGKKKGTK